MLTNIGKEEKLHLTSDPYPWLSTLYVKLNALNSKTKSNTLQDIQLFLAISIIAHEGNYVVLMII